MVTRFRAIVWVAVMGAAVNLGCTRQTVPPEQVAPAPPPVVHETPDHALLEQALQGGRPLSPGEALQLSDRMLTEGNASLKNEAVMARLELVLLKSLQAEDRPSRAGLLRNVGIIHYHQKQYKRARQELQAANELNPKDARTHFYLARLFAHQEQLYLKQGQKKKARSQAKLAKMELDLARKLEPGNTLYRQDLKEILRQEQGQ